ncbi:MAG TPA: MFS transporter [Candidatus Saccharimonadales bacterium]
MKVSKELSRGMVVLFTVACGLTVANLYYAQPLLTAIAGTLHVSSSMASLVIVVGQVGYVAGIALLVPLGDIMVRRRLIIALLLVASVASVVAAVAPSFVVLLIAALAVSLGTVVVLVLLPFAASLAAPERRGRIVGTIMTGVLMGVLLARTVSGFIAQATNWRMVYLFSAFVMLALAVLLGKMLPHIAPVVTLRYVELLQSTGSLIRTEPLLRKRAIYGFLSFAGFSALWTSLSFLLSDAYGFNQATIGLFGLAGLAGVLVAEFAGKLIDLGRERFATAGFLAIICISWWVMIDQNGHNLVLLLAGIILLDLGVQGAHVLNQGVIYRLQPEARGRMTTIYMTLYFLGGVLGSFASGQAYEHWGWAGVSVVGLIFAISALGVLFLSSPSKVR